MSKESLRRSAVNTRELREDDIPALRPILEHFVRDPQTGEVDKQEIDEIVEAMRNADKLDRHYKVAQASSGEVVGVMGLKPLHSFDPLDREMKDFAFTKSRPVVIQLVNAYVSPEYQRRGVGTKLLRELSHIAEELGYRELLVASDLGYQERHGFYDHMDFSRRGLLKRNGRGTAIVWSKII